MLSPKKASFSFLRLHDPCSPFFQESDCVSRPFVFPRCVGLFFRKVEENTRRNRAEQACGEFKGASESKASRLFFPLSLPRRRRSFFPHFLPRGEASRCVVCAMAVGLSEAEGERGRGAESSFSFFFVFLLRGAARNEGRGDDSSTKKNLKT